MSLGCSKWAWVQIEAGKCATMAQTVVLLKIADMSHDSGKTWAGAAYLAKCTGMTERTVREAIKAMDGTLVSVTPRPGRTAALRLMLTPYEYVPPTDDEIEDAAPRGRPQKTPEKDCTTPENGNRTPERTSDDTVLDTPRTTGDIAGDLFGGLPDKKPPRPLKIDVEGAFEEFWRFYPRKVSKGAAYAAFVKALDRIKDPDPVGVLMRGVISLSGECEGKDPQFTPHASTWLNQDGFYDEAGARRPTNVQRSNSASSGNSGRLDAFAQAAYELAEERRGRQ